MLTPRQITPLVLLLLLILPACTRDIPPPDNAIKDPGMLRAAVIARTERLETARFKEVVLDYYGEERFKVRQVIMVRAPDELRVQTKLPGSEELVSLLVSDGERFAMHKRDTNEYITGEPTREQINRMLPLDLSGRDVVSLMLGGVPWDRVEREPGPFALTWNKRTGRYRLSTPTQTGGTLAMEIRHTDFALVELLESDARDKTVYHYTAESWERHGELSLANYRRFIWPAKSLDFSLNVKETQVNVAFPDSIFTFDPPAGSTIISLDGPSAMPRPAAPADAPSPDAP